MSDDLVLGHLRAIRGDLSGLKADMIDVKERLGHIEGQHASISRRVDRPGGDVETIKRRLAIMSAEPTICNTGGA